jgi:beta-lactamase class A
MRPATITLLLAVGIMATASPCPSAAAADVGTTCWEGRVADAARYARSRPGQVAFAIVDPQGRVWHHRGRRRYPSRSLIKTTLLVAYLRQPGVRNRDLTAWEDRNLAAMIRRSDNDATNALLAGMSRRAIGRAVRATGQRDFRLELPVWGNSQTSAIDQVRMYWRLDRALPDRHRGYARRQLRSVVPSQRWGIPSAVPGDWTVMFKGGWGSGTGAMTGQAGRLERNGELMAIAVLARHSPNQTVAIRTLRGVSRRLLRGGPCAA